MHPFFHLEELVQRTFRCYSTSGELATLARVQRGLGSTALDILWEDVDINVLLYLFPSGVVRSPDTSLKLEFIKVPRKFDWERFTVYSPRIRTLRRTKTKVLLDATYFPDAPHFPDTAIREEIGNALFFLRHYPFGTPFPNLQHLDWYGAAGFELPELPTLLVPSLHTINLSGVFKGKFNPSRLTYNAALQVPLRVLADLSPSLRKLSMPIPDTIFDDELETEYLAACSSLMKNGLVDVTAPISVALLSILSDLQTLNTLTLQFSGERALHVAENFNRWLDEPNSPAADERAETSFPQLKTLRIENAPSLRIATSLIVKAYCHPTERISIECKRSPDRNEFSQFIERGLHSSCSTTLREFSLTTMPVFDAWADGNGLGGPSGGSDDTRITVDHLQPLADFSALEVLKIDLQYPLVSTDAQLKDFVFAFPSVTELSVCPYIDSEFFPDVFISPRGLAALSSHPRLRKFGVYLNITKEALQFPLIASSECDSPLTVLDVGDSSLPPHCVAALLLFLVHHFPDINDIIWNRIRVHQPWLEVLHGLESTRRYCRHYRMLGRTPESS